MALPYSEALFSFPVPGMGEIEILVCWKLVHDRAKFSFHSAAKAVSSQVNAARVYCKKKVSSHIISILNW